jgi:hypothetical protein
MPMSQAPAIPADSELHRNVHRSRHGRLRMGQCLGFLHCASALQRLLRAIRAGIPIA